MLEKSAQKPSCFPSKLCPKVKLPVMIGIYPLSMVPKELWMTLVSTRSHPRYLWNQHESEELYGVDRLIQCEYAWISRGRHYR